MCRIVSDMYLLMLCNPAQMATVWQNAANQNKVNCYRLLLQVLFFFLTKGTLQHTSKWHHLYPGEWITLGQLQPSGLNY